MADGPTIAPCLSAPPSPQVIQDRLSAASPDLPRASLVTFIDAFVSAEVDACVARRPGGRPRSE
jgi:hypothetical protein